MLTFPRSIAVLVLAGVCVQTGLAQAQAEVQAQAQVQAQGDRAAAGERPARKPAAKQVVQFTLTGLVTDSPKPPDPFEVVLGGHLETVSVRELSDRFGKAANSDAVAAVVLVLDQPTMTLTQALELRPLITAIRDAGKPVLAFSDSYDLPGYVLASAAEKVYLSPGGEIDISGIVLQLMYVRETLAKLGMTADFIHVGAYKGAAEPLTQDGPSPEVEANLTNVVESLYASMAKYLSAVRGLNGEQVIDGGPYTAREALENKLVDGLEHRLDVVGLAIDQSGLPANTAVVHNFGIDKQKKLDLSNPFALLTALQQRPSREPKKPAIGVIYADGVIALGESTEAGLMGGQLGSKWVIAACEKARKDDSIKAVVLRVNSPGGSATASEAMYAAVRRLAQVKPVIASVGDIAASGGYYLIVATPYIVVQDHSLIGSIGVVGGKLITGGLYEWIGVKVHPIVRGGPKARLLDETRPFTEPEREWVLKSMTQVYELFLNAVKQGRGDRVHDLEEKLAGGRIFTGAQAVENGLADEVGGLSHAIALAAERVDLGEGEYIVRTVPEPKGFLEKLIDELSGNTADDKVRHGGFLTAHPAGSATGGLLAVLNELSPAHARALMRQVALLRQLADERVLMAMPFAIELRLGR